MKLKSLSILVVIGGSLFVGVSQSATISKADISFSNVKMVAGASPLAGEVCRCFENKLKEIDGRSESVDLSSKCKLLKVKKLKTLITPGSANQVVVSQSVVHVQLNGKSEKIPFVQVLIGKEGESKEGYLVSSECMATVHVKKIS